MIEVNAKRVARNCRILLDSANAHMKAVGAIQHLNAYLYASMVRGMTESLMDSIDVESDQTYQQMQSLDVEAIALCQEFERSYNVISALTEQEDLFTPPPAPEPVVAPEPKNVKKNGYGYYESSSKAAQGLAKTHEPGVGVGRHHGDRTHRLEQHERIAIHDYFTSPQMANKVTTRDVNEAAVMYQCSPTTILYWIQNNPHRDVKSF